ncbi:MAG TPA: SPOR domain-containing protein [Candidatus Treponema faecavium]|nr:SPOR domain-containing protein [Candidatus Treponema faecavium]
MIKLFFRGGAAALLLCMAHALAALPAAQALAQYQEQTASGALTLQQAATALLADAENAASAADRRSLYAAAGNMQEQMGLYSQAVKSYAAAAAINSGPADGMPRVSAETLVLKAIRCSLSMGNYEQAARFLNSDVKNSRDETVIAYTKLYNIWSALCQTDSQAQLHEPVVLLESYVSMDSMKAVQPAMLLTLFYITGEQRWKDELASRYPDSPEAAAAAGNADMIPTPFWFFVPREGAAPAAAESPNPAPAAAAAESGTGRHREHAARWQLGFFRNRDNAQALLDTLAASGFDAEIQNETRQSGTVYYTVTVEENAGGATGDALKAAGFDCYPLFE